MVEIQPGCSFGLVDKFLPVNNTNRSEMRRTPDVVFGCSSFFISFRRDFATAKGFRFCFRRPMRGYSCSLIIFFCKPSITRTVFTDKNSSTVELDPGEIRQRPLLRYN